MNNSGSSAGCTNCSYVSCIEVDGRPILPPIMTDSLRIEMRRYRELAVRIENTLQFQRNRSKSASTKQDTTTIPTTGSPTKVTSKPTEILSGNQQEEDKQLQEILDGSPILSADVSLKMSTPQLQYEEHFVIKRPYGPAFPSDGDSSSSNDSDDSSSSPLIKVSCKAQEQQSTADMADEDKQNDDNDQTEATSIDSQMLSFKTQRDSLHPLQEDDNKSESMSLVSLDTEDEAQRHEIENNTESSDSERSGDNSPENCMPNSGRSSTETFIIERHSISDSDNNNELTTTTAPSTRKYFFSPLHSEESSDNSIIFNCSATPNTKPVKPSRPRPSILGVTRYFDSPAPSGTSPSDVTLTEVSFTTSTASIVSSPSTTSMSVATKESRRLDTSKVPQNSPVSSATYSPMSSGREFDSRKRIYFSSPEAPNKASNADETHVPPNTPSSQYSLLDDSPRKSTREAGTQMAPYRRNEASPDMSSQTSSLQSKALDSGVSFAELNSRLNRVDQDASSTLKSKQSQSSALGRVNLVTLHSAMHNMSPSLLKLPPDYRSSLLKGVVLTDPLYRPRKELRIPPQALDPAMKPKFDRISAHVKGYLIRRILRTEKIQMIIQTIRDSVELVLKLYEEVPQLRSKGSKGIKQDDADLCRRLLQQLTGACASFYDVFFKLTTPQRMAIIANDREKLKAKEMKVYYARSRSGGNVSGAKQKHFNNPKRKISTATVKSLARRKTIHS